MPEDSRKSHENEAEAPFTTDAIKAAQLGDLQRRVCIRLVQVLDEYEPSEIQVVLVAVDDSHHIVEVEPARKECCPLRIWLYRDTIGGTIGFGAGQEAYVNIPEDVPPYPAP